MVYFINQHLFPKSPYGPSKLSPEIQKVVLFNSKVQLLFSLALNFADSDYNGFNGPLANLIKSKLHNTHSSPHCEMHVQALEEARFHEYPENTHPQISVKCYMCTFGFHFDPFI